MTAAPEASSSAATDTEASDAELISRVRGGDVDAYGGLFERHRDAANRLARQLLPGPDADDLVAEAFTKVLNVLMAGGGPDVALRPYLLTAIRRLHVDKIRATKRAMPTDDLTPYDPGVPFSDTVVAGFEGGAAAQAFASLPERWQLVLWHLEVEGQKPADIAPLLGMTPNSVSALAYRAREGLRQAFLQMHTADLVEEDCRWTHDKLGAYVRNGLSRRDNVKVEAHLDGCRKCTAIFLELRDVNSELAALLGPVVLGTAAAGYLGATATGVVKGGLLVTLLGGAKDKLANPATAGVAAAAALALAVGGGLALVKGGDDAPPATAQGPSDGTNGPSTDTPPGSTPPDKTPPKSTDKPTTDAPPVEAPPVAPPAVQPVADTPPADTTAPTAPANLRVITSTARSGGLRTMAVAAGSFRAVWERSSDNEGVSAYDIHVNGKRVASVRTPGYTFSHLQAGKQYVVYVVARDAAGNRSARSNTVRFSTDGPTTPPGDTQAPDQPVPGVTGSTQSTISVAWPEAADNVGTTSYDVYVDGVRRTSTQGRTYTATGLTPGEAYEIGVVAIDAAGNRSTTGTTTGTTDQAPVDHPPSAPVIVRVDLGLGLIVWLPAADPDGDPVTYSVEVDGHIVVSGLTGLQYLTHLAVGVQVVVIAEAGGLTTESFPFEVTAPPASPTVSAEVTIKNGAEPVDLTVSDVPPGGVTVTLSLGGGATWLGNSGCSVDPANHVQTCTLQEDGVLHLNAKNLAAVSDLTGVWSTASNNGTVTITQR